MKDDSSAHPARIATLVAVATVSLLALSACGSSPGSGAGSGSIATSTTAQTGPAPTGVAPSGGIAAQALPMCDDTPGPLVLALGAHRNGPNPTTLPAPITTLISDDIDASQLITVMVVDGQPAVVGSGAFKPTAENPEQLKQQKAEFIAAMNQVLATKVVPTHAEVDSLAALQLAARSARPTAGSGSGSGQASPHQDPGMIVLSDSLLSTTGPLNFTQPGLLDADPTEVVNFLQKTNEIPDLTGIGVTLYGAGDVAPPQPALLQPQRDNLLAIWTGIITAGNARCLTVVQSPNSAPPAIGKDAPAVSIVTLPAPPTLQPPATTTATARTTTTARVTVTATASTVVSASPPMVLPDDAIFGFAPDSAKLRNPAAAAEALTPFAEWLAQDGSHHVLLTGTTARVGDIDGQRALSDKRAQAIKDVLVQDGAPAGQIRTSGVGSEWPCYTADHDAAGNLLPGPAQLNRTVIVLPFTGREVPPITCHR